MYELLLVSCTPYTDYNAVFSEFPLLFSEFPLLFSQAERVLKNILSIVASADSLLQISARGPYYRPMGMYSPRYVKWHSVAQRQMKRFFVQNEKGGNTGHI